MDTRTFEVFRDTQAQLITSPFVLNTALRELETKNISMLTSEDNQLAFLQDELRTSFPGKGEILRVSLKGEDTDDVKEVVQEVMEAYLEEIGNTEAILALQKASEKESDLVVKIRIERALAAIAW